MDKDFFNASNEDEYSLARQTSYEDMPVLKVGDSGDNVLILNEKLKILGYLSIPVNEGFDKTTKKAVKDFQKSNNLEETGIVDESTWQPLFQQTETDFPNTPFSLTLPTLRLGSTGQYVMLLQTQLAQMQYYAGAIDGVFGTSTQTAVRMFQAVNQLTADGIVGRATWAALDYLYSPLAICGEGETTPTPPSENIHIVQAGDTLFSIANRYGTTVDEIIRLNNLTSTALQIGQRLIIPGGGTPPSENIHIVQAGDTLFSIANRYGTTVDAIIQLNNLTSTNLEIGQQLLIPGAGTPETILYTVQAGDTLFALARTFNTTVDEIRRLNNLTSDALSIGQQLLIPSSGNVPTFIEHVVVAGDSLFALARRFGTTVDEIMRVNNLSSTSLRLGQVLRIPR